MLQNLIGKKITDIKVGSQGIEIVLEGKNKKRFSLSIKASLSSIAPGFPEMVSCQVVKLNGKVIFKS